MLFWPAVMLMKITYDVILLCHHQDHHDYQFIIISSNNNNNRFIDITEQSDALCISILFYSVKSYKYVKFINNSIKYYLILTEKNYHCHRLPE